MTTNLIDRIPVPGSFGVQPSTDVIIHISTTGTISSATITVAVNGTNAILLGAFQSGFGGTIVTDGGAGWVVTINPTASFDYGSTVTVDVSCTEEPGSVPFTQSYSFDTIRNIALVPAVTYYEEGDVIEADFWVHENSTSVPLIVDALTVSIKQDDVIVDVLSLDNSNHNMHNADGAFRTRWLHPIQIKQDMTFEVSAVIDSFQAPGVGTLTLTDTISWEGRTSGIQPMAQQPDLNLNANVERTPTSQYNTETAIQQKQASHEVIDLKQTGESDTEPTTLVDLDFLNTTQYLQELTGDLTYTGGGNRLLNGVGDTNDWFAQEADELPVIFGARMPVEGAAINLLAHSTFDTNEFVLDVPDTTIRADVEVAEFITGVNMLSYAVEGSVVYDGDSDRNIAIQSPKVTMTPSEPVMCSVLARTQLRDSTVTLDKFAIRVKFWNNSDVQTGSTDFNFDIFDFESDTTFKLMEAFIPLASIPGGSTKVSFDIVIGSWEGCDLMNLQLVAPMIEHALFSTSRVIGTAANTERAADSLRIQQAGNINQRTGRVSVTYAPEYSGAPDTDVTLFDTRNASTLRSGYTLRHRTDGYFELTVVSDAGATTTLTSDAAVALDAGEPVELVAKWAPSSLSILKNLVVLGSSSSAYTQPSTIQSEISIGQKITGTEQLYGELQRFTSFGVA